MQEFSRNTNQSTAVDKAAELREMIKTLTGCAMSDRDESVLARYAAFFFRQRKESIEGQKRINVGLRSRLEAEDGAESAGRLLSPDEKASEFAQLMCASRVETQDFVPEEETIRDLADALREVCGESHPLTLWKTERELFDNLSLTARLLALEAESLVRESKYISNLIDEKENR